MMKFEHLLSPMKVGKQDVQKPYRERTDGIWSDRAESGCERFYLS